MARLEETLSKVEIGGIYKVIVSAVKKDRVNFYVKGCKEITATWHMKGGKFNPFVEFRDGDEVSVKLEGVFHDDDFPPREGSRKRSRHHWLVKPLETPPTSFLARFLAENDCGDCITGTIAKIIRKKKYCKRLLIEVDKNTYALAPYCNHAKVGETVRCSDVRVDGKGNLKCRAQLAKTA